MKFPKSLLLAGAVSALLVPTMVSAVPIHYIEVIYYNDANFSWEVGGHITPCTSYPYSWGEVTPYSRTFTEDCPTGHH